MYSFFYFLPEVGVECSKMRLCKAFYVKTLDVSQSRISYVHNMRKSDTGTPRVNVKLNNENRKRVIPDAQKQSVRDHINSLPTMESHYCRSNSRRKYFESHLNINRLYALYKAKCLKNGTIPVKIMFVC